MSKDRIHELEKLHALDDTGSSMGTPPSIVHNSNLLLKMKAATDTLKPRGDSPSGLETPVSAPKPQKAFTSYTVPPKKRYVAPSPVPTSSQKYARSKASSPMLSKFSA